MANFALRQSIALVAVIAICPSTNSNEVQKRFIAEGHSVKPLLEQCNVVCSVLIKLKCQNMLEKIVEIKVIHSEVKMLFNEIERLKMQKESIEKQIASVEKTIENKVDESFKLSIEVDDINTNFLIKKNL